MKKTAALALLLAALNSLGLAAQDFGFGSDEGGGAALPVSVKIGGKIGAVFLGYVHDFKSSDKLKETTLGDIVSGSLNFSASGANVDAFIGLNLSAASFGELFGGGAGSPVYTPLILDEAYLRAFFGPVNIEAGLRKLTWGKADSLGPLDVVNPLDYTDLTNITDIMAIKIARPMLHLAWNMDSFSKLEAVFVPNFAGHRFASSGRWAPAQFKNYPAVVEAGIKSKADELFGNSIPSGVTVDIDAIKNNIRNNFDMNSLPLGNTGGLEYFQTGLRYTATIGSADIGAQYFYGNLFRPSVTIGGVDDFFADLVAGIIPQLPNPTYLGEPALLSVQLKYNRYHQLGIDYAQVLAGFNIRSEFAVHLTEDLAGDDGAVRNPFIGWSLGFDRDIAWGITANIQCNETVRLLDSKVGSNPAFDCEAGTSLTSTRLTTQFSKKFLKDNLECKTSAIWDIEAKGCYIIPAIAWTIRDITAELSAGVFAGEDSGELGQYWENTFVKVGLKYSF